MPWRRVMAVGVAAFLAALLLLVANVGGWRARLIARIFRVENYPLIAPWPSGIGPQIPPGFHVSVFADGFVVPRWLAVAPNGDVWVSDSAVGQVIVLHGVSAWGRAESRLTFAEHLNLPFGIAFHDEYVYVADTNEVLRFRYDPHTSKRLGNAEHVLDLPGMGYHQHWTRSLAFSTDGKIMFVSVGSQTNESIESDKRRGAILAADPDGTRLQIYASGLRNAVGIGIEPESHQLWASINERDDLGDDIPQDYFTHVVQNGFYGWPYSYLGNHPDNRVSPRPDLVAKAIVPELLLGAHVAPLQFVFYEAQQFPAKYVHGAFIAEHGSWNRRLRAGYQVVFVPFHNGSPSGAPEPFLSGFVRDPAGKAVYGRVVGIAVAQDGALLVSDDGAKLIWRVTYGGPS